MASLADAVGAELSAVREKLAPQEPATAPQSARAPASVVRLRPRDTGEALATIEELTRVNRMLQEELARVQGVDRSTLEALQAQVRERDVQLRALQARLRTLEAELSDRGAGSNQLRLERQADRERIEALERELASAQEALVEAESSRGEDSLTSILEAFRRLVTVEIPRWSEPRDVFLRNAARALETVAQAHRDAQGALHCLRERLADLSDAHGTALLNQILPTGTSRLEVHRLARDVVALREEWEEAAQAFDKASQRRHECLRTDGQQREQGAVLRARLDAFVQVFVLAGLDPWELTGLNPRVKSLLDDRPLQMQTIQTTLTIGRLTSAEEERLRELTSSILPPAPAPPTRRGPVRGVPPKEEPEDVVLLPGRLLRAQSERELEILAALAVLTWRALAPLGRRMDARDCWIALKASKLVAPELSVADVVRALQEAVSRQGVSKGEVRDGKDVRRVYAPATAASTYALHAEQLLGRHWKQVQRAIESAVHNALKR